MSGKILIVDDEEVIRDALYAKLSRDGYECMTAESADSAIVQLSKSAFDLVILDINMPGKTGIEALPEIKEQCPDTSVIMATAIYDISVATSCMQHGAYDYITKPFDVKTIILSIEKALDKRRLELENRDYRLHLEEKVEEQAQEIERSFVNALTSLVIALEAKDKYTSGHSQRVSQIAVNIAREMGLSQEEIEKIKLAGLLHDIGKIGVKESILNKNGKLTPEEYQHVISHCQIGEQILKPIMSDPEILKMVRHHHERYDGSGYPDGLSGEMIPTGAKIIAVADMFANNISPQENEDQLSQGARILAVADAYDAMVSNRPYRSAMPVEKALREIKRMAGIQFDSLVVESFLQTVDGKESPNIESFYSNEINKPGEVSPCELVKQLLS